MNNITNTDWGFENIRAVDKMRAERLEHAGSPHALAEVLARELRKAMECREVRFATDSKRNEFKEWRAIVQFRVKPENYDWFFNARTGYRAQFYRSPAKGIDFNKIVVGSLSKVLSQCLPEAVRARQVDVNPSAPIDMGTITVTRDVIINSLAPTVAKIWIVEQRYDDEKPCNVGLVVLSDAARYLPKLSVPLWAKAKNSTTGEIGEGLRALFPSTDMSWLDLKGGFLDAEGNYSQIKPQEKRARQLHSFGWT